MRLKPEEAIQIACVQYTRVFCPKISLVASLNGVFLGKKKTPQLFAYINKLKQLGMKVGDPDLRLHWQAASGLPYTLYVECKAGKNKPTEEQVAFCDEMQAIGIPTAFIWTLEEYVAVLREHQAPMRANVLLPTANQQRPVNNIRAASIKATTTG